MSSEAILLLNPEHPLVRQALGRSAEAPLLSAFVLAKAILLNDGIPDAMEARLLSRCLSARPHETEGLMAFLRQRLVAHRMVL